MERSYFVNGRFLHNLSGWTTSNAVYSAGDGGDHYGVAVLATGGGYIEQNFAVIDVRLYSLHTSIKGIGGAITSGQVTVTITDSEGNTVKTINLLTSASDTWQEAVNSIGLAEGTTYTIRVTNVSAVGDVHIDDLWIWFLPVTRIQLAERIHAKLGRLATDRTLTFAILGDKTEGHYTFAIDAALRSFGALNPITGNPDIRYLDADNVQSVLEMVRGEMLEFLQAEYAVEVDTSTGPYSQSLSQKTKLIGDILGSGGSSSSGSSGGSSGPVIQRTITYD